MDDLNIVRDKTKELCELLGVSSDVIVVQRNGTLMVNITAAHPGLLIGEGGETLASLQHIIRLLLTRVGAGEHRIVVDVNGYRNRRTSSIERTAKEYISRIQTTGLKEVLPPMNAFERRIVHEMVSKTDDLESSSTGEGDDRRVVIKTKKG